MKLILTLILALTLVSCGDSRKEQDITDNDSTNISPNQQISPGEADTKDSTSGDLLGSDTTRNAQP